MTEPRYPTLADWRALALEAIDASNEDTYVESLRCELGAVRTALLAAEDQHPPTVHVHRTHRWVPTTVFAVNSQVLSAEYAWNLREANGRIIATAGESFVDKAHAVAMARRIAGGLGGRVIDDDTGEDITGPTTEVE